MRRIIHFTTVHSRHDIRIFQKQCRSIASHGHDVTIVVLDGKGDETRDGVKIRDIGAPYANRILRILFSPWKVYRFLRSMPADIFHFHDPELLPVGFLLKLGNRHVIYDSHEDVPRQLLTKHWIPSVLRKTVSVVFEAFEDFVAKRLDAIVCATPFIAKRFRNINSNSTDVNNFPLPGEFDPQHDEQPTVLPRTLCYVGAITRERGVSELVAALEILPNITLIMCGPFESRAYADELMSMPGWNFVDYRGIVGRDQVGKIMTSSAIGIVTFLPGPNHNDSQPNKMFEYMSAGIPLVASDFPLWRQIVEDSQCGLCVDPSSPRDIASAVENLLSDESLRQAKGRSGRKAIEEKFNWGHEAEKLMAFYDSIK